MFWLCCRIVFSLLSVFVVWVFGEVVVLYLFYSVMILLCVVWLSDVVSVSRLLCLCVFLLGCVVCLIVGMLLCSVLLRLWMMYSFSSFSVLMLGSVLVNMSVIRYSC